MCSLAPQETDSTRSLLDVIDRSPGPKTAGYNDFITQRFSQRCKSLPPSPFLTSQSLAPQRAESLRVSPACQGRQEADLGQGRQAASSTTRLSSFSSLSSGSTGDSSRDGDHARTDSPSNAEDHSTDSGGEDCDDQEEHIDGDLTERPSTPTSSVHSGSTKSTDASPASVRSAATTATTATTASAASTTSSDIQRTIGLFPAPPGGTGSSGTIQG